MVILNKWETKTALKRWCHIYIFSTYLYLTASETSVDELDDYMASALAEMEISLLTVKDDRDLTDTQFHKLLKCLLQKTNQGNWNQGN